MLMRKPLVRDSFRELKEATTQTNEAAQLQEKASAVMRKDTGIFTEIGKRYQDFESSGESDNEDLKERLLLMKNYDGTHFKGKDGDNQFSMNDVVVEIHNHVSAVMQKFKKRKKMMLAALRADINYQIAVKVNKTSKDLADL